MDIIVHLPIIYVMTFLIAAFFEKKIKKQKLFIVLAFISAIIKVVIG